MFPVEGVSVNYPRVEYQMTEEDMEKLLKACQPVPMIMVGGYAGRSAQERANDAWAELGQRMGFDAMTVQPIQSKGDRWFTAVPSETEKQRDERLELEHKARIKQRKAELKRAIDEAQEELDKIVGSAWLTDRIR
jgi:hypothetical protein